MYLLWDKLWSKKLPFSGIFGRFGYHFGSAYTNISPKVREAAGEMSDPGLKLVTPCINFRDGIDGPPVNNKVKLERNRWSTCNRYTCMFQDCCNRLSLCFAWPMVLRWRWDRWWSNRRCQRTLLSQPIGTNTLGLPVEYKGVRPWLWLPFAAQRVGGRARLGGMELSTRFT